MDLSFPTVRRGNSSVIVHFRLWFSKQLRDPGLEEEALRQGLAATLNQQGILLPAYGIIASAILIGTLAVCPPFPSIKVLREVSGQVTPFHSHN